MDKEQDYMSLNSYDELDDILKKYLDEDDFKEKPMSRPDEREASTKKKSPTKETHKGERKVKKEDSIPKKGKRTKGTRNKKKREEDERTIKNKRKAKRNIVKNILVFLLFIILFFGSQFLYNLLFNQVKKEINLEIGTSLEITDVVNFGVDKASFVSEELEVLKTLGTYIIQVNKSNKIYEVIVNVIDTTSPSAEGLSLFLSKALDIKPEQCVTNVKDETELTYNFVSNIDMNSDKEQKITVLLEDLSGNTTKVTSYITLSDDITPPVLEGEDLFESPLNEGVSYKKIVTATDDSGEEVTLDIDNSSVDVSKEGNYKVVYTATDHVGNVAVKEITITVYKKSQSQEKVEERAKEVIAEIIEDGMTDKEKATAIFYWVRNNIAYTGTTARDSWVDGAYAGFFNKAGDCYAYAMTTKALLNTAGIVNMDIVKIPTTSSHFWNLVDVGDGWIHLDTTRRKDGTLICLWDDAKLMTYSNANKNSHNYDTSQYPTIN